MKNNGPHNSLTSLKEEIQVLNEISLVSRRLAQKLTLLYLEVYPDNSRGDPKRE